ncbi:hypothetical protein ACHAW5_007228 [Stephanodiscus triporus]|uniref:Uncharacterized protein n=1 Tax=Stephanodiscus triporus TaxID=2934178 RepID=A0ABD3Q7G3_9STRA
MVHSKFTPDPLCYVPINSKLKCEEEWTPVYGTDESDDDDFHHCSPITFHITLPTRHHYVKLSFNCQDKSSGVLLPSEPVALPSADNADNENMSDPFFFEKGFYLEAKTGFQPWPGTRLMIEAFTCMKNKRMEYWQTRLASKDLTILEVGAGVGIVGACLAAVGGNVLLTDLQVLVEHSIGPNLKRNEHRVNKDNARGKHLDFFIGSHECSHIEDGWAQAAVLDWYEPIAEQLPHTTSSAFDVIVANMMGVFIGMEELLERIVQRGWGVECVAWRTIAVEGDGEQNLHLFEITPAKS